MEDLCTCSVGHRGDDRLDRVTDPLKMFWYVCWSQPLSFCPSVPCLQRASYAGAWFGLLTFRAHICSCQVVIGCAAGLILVSVLPRPLLNLSLHLTSWSGRSKWECRSPLIFCLSRLWTVRKCEDSDFDELHGDDPTWSSCLVMLLLFTRERKRERARGMWRDVYGYVDIICGWRRGDSLRFLLRPLRQLDSNQLIQKGESDSSWRNNSLLLLLIKASEFGSEWPLKCQCSWLMDKLLCKALWGIVYEVLDVSPKQRRGSSIWFPHVTAGFTVCSSSTSQLAKGSPLCPLI